MTIQDVQAFEIFDSRGNPTLEAVVILSDGTHGRAAVPSGASTGALEAKEWRDRDPKRFDGKGVLGAVRHVTEVIRPALRGSAPEQDAIDRQLIMLDGTPDKSRLGANAVLAVSLAVARARAAAERVPLYRALGATAAPVMLPVPMINILNGGVHAPNALDFQEFMIVPVGAPSIREALRWSAEVFHGLRRLLQDEGHITAVGDEGGYAPNLSTPEEALDMLVRAIQHAAYVPGVDLALAVDPAASELFHHGRYELRKSGLPTRDAAGMIDWLTALVEGWPLISIEDGLAEDDWPGWKQLTARLGQRVMLVGDDIFVTNPAIIRRGIAEGLANAVLIKPNQIGTLTETLEAIAVARRAGYRIVISHRSGETEDPFIADLAVAVGADFIKTGSLARSERTAKYNRLMRIEDELGASARYAGQRG